MIEKIGASFKRKLNPKQKEQHKHLVENTGYSYIVVHKQKSTMFQKETGYTLTVQKLIPNIQGLVDVGFNNNHTEGLVLFTNDLSLKLCNIETEFVIKTDKPITPEFFKQISRGVMVKSELIKPIYVEKIDYKHLRIVLEEKIDNQIELMLQTVGYHAIRVMRVRIDSIVINDLRKKQWRFLSVEEINKLKERKENMK
jgi:pseudouridine synthase